MASRRNPFARAVASAFTLLFLRVTGCLPLRLNRIVALWGGRALSRVIPRVRRVALANLELAFGNTLGVREKVRICRDAVDNVALVAAEFAHLRTLARDPDLVAVEGADLLAPDQGYLCVAAHLGNWELMGPVMAAQGHKVAEVVRPFDDPRVDRAIDAIRTGTGIITIPKDNAGREITRLLKEGYLVGVLIDQSPRDNGVPVTFFGAPCWATIAPVMIAVRARVPIVPTTLTRGRDGRYILRFYPPIDMERTGDLRADLVRNSQRCQNVIEEAVRATPGQWLWLHRRWKERPRLAAEWAERAARDR